MMRDRNETASSSARLAACKNERNVCPGDGCPCTLTRYRHCGSRDIGWGLTRGMSSRATTTSPLRSRNTFRGASRSTASAGDPDGGMRRGAGSALFLAIRFTGAGCYHRLSLMNMTPVRDNWNYRPVQLETVWTLTKRAHVAHCVLFSHEFGWELRLEVGELFRTSRRGRTAAGAFPRSSTQRRQPSDCRRRRARRGLDAARALRTARDGRPVQPPSEANRREGRTPNGRRIEGPSIAASVCHHQPKSLVVGESESKSKEAERTAGHNSSSGSDSSSSDSERKSSGSENTVAPAPFNRL